GAAAPAEVPGALGFVREGVHHILTGYDHVLFLLLLLLPSVMRRTPQGWQPVARLSEAIWPVVGIVSAFTVAHSITLGLAALQIVSLPSALIEPAIAVTIILAALDNVWPIFPVRRVVVTFLFGLIHGFGFAGVLAELNLPTADFAWALLQFNVGLELGQLLIVVAVTALLFALRQWPRYRPLVIRGGSFAALAIGVLWLIERTANVTLLPM
ncbi:MAG TPA: HupE/UreJ family protein, partial [Burkholderiaceae bacterium]